MRGLAAELRGARDWMKVATAWLVGESGINPYTCTIQVFGGEKKGLLEGVFETQFSLSLRNN